MIRDTLIKICKEYQTQKNKENRDYVSEIRNDVKSSFSNILKDLLADIKIKTVQGIGNMSDIAWISFLHERAALSTTEGYYPAYLFSEDSKQFELALVQGLYSISDEYTGKGGTEAVSSFLKTRATILRGKLKNENNNYFDEKLSKNITFLKNDLVRKQWQTSAVFGKVYHIDKLPSEDELIEDLKKIIELYKLVIQKGGTAQEGIIEIYDQENEDLSGDEKVINKKHKENEEKIIQVNRPLINDLKKHYKYTCQACGLILKDIYGDYFGEKPEYIEAHHIIPKSKILKKLKENDKLKRTKEDFAILCANCHRIIHRYNAKLKKDLTLEEFKLKINK